MAAGRVAGQVIVAALIAGILVFVAVLRVLDAAGAGSRAVRTARAAAATLRDRSLTDDEKERAARTAAVGLFRSFLAIALIGAAALAAPAVLIWAGSAAGFYSMDALVAVATGWPFLLGSTLVAVVAWFAMEKLA